jgi:hypothetical protein
MSRRIISIAAAGLLVLGAAVPAFAADGDPGKLMVMSHACTEKPVKNEADFKAIVDQAKGDEVTALALTVLACPTIVLAANEGDRTDGVAGPAVDFDFTLTDSNGDTQTLDDAEFVSAKLCETDIDRDANGDGKKTDDVCLDISHYMFSNVPAGKVTLKETSAPNGWMFGTMLLTPKSLQASGSDDAATGADYNARTATVTLDLAGDTDNSAMLHIYNFEKSPATDTIGADAPDAAPAFLRAF